MLPSTLHAQNLPQELQAHHICINVENVGEGGRVQSEDFELEEEHLNAQAMLSATRGCWLEAKTTILSSCGQKSTLRNRGQSRNKSTYFGFNSSTYVPQMP